MEEKNKVENSEIKSSEYYIIAHINNYKYKISGFTDGQEEYVKIEMKEKKARDFLRNFFIRNKIKSELKESEGGYSLVMLLTEYNAIHIMNYLDTKESVNPPNIRVIQGELSKPKTSFFSFVRRDREQEDGDCYKIVRVKPRPTSSKKQSVLIIT